MECSHRLRRCSAAQRPLAEHIDRAATEGPVKFKLGQLIARHSHCVELAYKLLSDGGLSGFEQFGDQDNQEARPEYQLGMFGCQRLPSAEGKLRKNSGAENPETEDQVKLLELFSSEVEAAFGFQPQGERVRAVCRIPVRERVRRN